MGEILKDFALSFNGSIRLEARQERLTTESGALLLREVDERLGLSRWLGQRLEVETICGKRGISIAASEIARATETPRVLVSSRRYLVRRAAARRMVGPRFRESASSVLTSPRSVLTGDGRK